MGVPPLDLSPEVALPAETVTDTVAVFGTRGTGKTSTAAVIVEEAHARSLPVVVLDPKGDWWGLRSAADGGEGLPFIVFGGDHADVPLEDTAGALLADLIIDQRLDAVLDLSDMSKTKRRSFATDFAERLYRRNREALLVVVDEADMLIPQRASAHDARLVGAWDDIAKRGRGRGLGMLVITQRPQDVAKSVLDEMHTLILHGLIGPRAVKAVKDWIVDHEDVEGSRTKEVLQSLRSLDPGEGWVWAPQHRMLERTQVRRIRTFDSHATPEPGVRRRQPTARAAVDLAALGAAIAETVQRAEANDPAALRRRITELERALADEIAKPPPLQLEPEVRTLVTFTDTAIEEFCSTAETLSANLLEVLQQVEAMPILRRESDPPKPAAPLVAGPVRAPAPPSPRVASGPTVELPKAQRAILAVLRHGEATRAQVALRTVYAPSGGGFGNALSALRTAGYLEGRDPLSITDAGADAIGPVPAPPTGTELRERWKAHSAIGKAAGLILDALAEAAPDRLERSTLAERTGYEASGGGFGNALSRLRTLGLIEGGASLIIARELVD